MAGLRGYFAAVVASFVGLATLCAGIGAARAGSKETSYLYDRPVLAIEVGAHTAAIRSQAVDAAGRFAVTGGDDRTVRIWSIADGKLERTIRIPLGPDNVGHIYAVAISPDGSTIAAGGWTGPLGNSPIYIFERGSGNLTKRIADVQIAATALAFSPDGKFLAAVLGGGYGLRIFEANTGWREVFADSKYGDRSDGVAFAPDGRLATVAFDGYLRLYADDPKSGNTNFRAVGNPVPATGGRHPYGVAFSSDSKRLAIAYEDNTVVEVLDAATLLRLKISRPTGIHVTPEGFARVAWSRDSQTLFAVGAVRDEQNRDFLYSWNGEGLGDERRTPYCVQDSGVGVNPLADGNVLVAATDCLGLANPKGSGIWSVKAPVLNLNNQTDVMRASADGTIVDFGDYRYAFGFRFDTRSLTLSVAPRDDPSTFPPKRDGLAVDGWRDGRSLHIADVRILYKNYDISRSLAVEPAANGFYLGSMFRLSAFDSKGGQRWTREAAHGEVRAVNASRDGRLLVAAYGDGTIRWHRAEDGAELLALQVIPNKGDVSQWDWVLWTPDGFYEATEGAKDVLRWVVNHGPDHAATTKPVSAIPGLHRRTALPRILETLDPALALGRDDIATARANVKVGTLSAKAPGPVLHVLTIGIDKFGDAAGGLHLDYAAKDALDVGKALFDSQTIAPSLYADVEPEEPLIDEKASRRQINDALDRIAEKMRKHEAGQDVAVIFVSTHGEIIGDPGAPDHSQFYLAPYGFDISSKNASTDTGLPLTDFLDKVSELAEHGKVLLLIDACHSGAAEPGGWMRTPNAERLRTTIVNQNVAVLTSSSRDEQSNELPEYGHGAFAQAFLDALGSAGDSDGVVSLSTLADRMDDEVEALTKNLKFKQHLGRNLNFNRKLFVASKE